MSNKDRFAGKFEFLEHTADAYVRAFGVTIQEAFENAALALFETMTDSSRIARVQQVTIEVEAEDQYALLYNWLETLLVKFETEGMLYSFAQIRDWVETCDKFKFLVDVWGEKFDPKKHPQKVGVKAVTYHRMVVIREFDRVILEFILDI